MVCPTDGKLCHDIRCSSTHCKLPDPRDAEIARMQDRLSIADTTNECHRAVIEDRDADLATLRADLAAEREERTQLAEAVRRLEALLQAEREKNAAPGSVHDRSLAPCSCIPFDDSRPPCGARDCIHLPTGQQLARDCGGG